MNKINKFKNALYHLAYIDGKDEKKGELTKYINKEDNKATIYKLVNFDDKTSLVYTICGSDKKVTPRTTSYYIAKSDGESDGKKDALECGFLCQDDYMDTDKYHENFVIVSDGAPNSDDGGKSIVKSGAKADPTPTQTVYYIDVNTGLVYDENYEVIGYYETYPAPINRLSVPREKGIIKTPGRLVPTKPNKTIVEPKYVRDLESNKSLDVILKDLGKGIGDVVTELYEDPTAEHKTIKPELLPSYVDDVIEGYMTDDTFYDEDDNPIIPEKGKIYLDTETNKSYRWTGSEYYEFVKEATIVEMIVRERDNEPFVENSSHTPSQVVTLVDNNETVYIKAYYDRGYIYIPLILKTPNQITFSLSRYGGDFTIVGDSNNSWNVNQRPLPQVDWNQSDTNALDFIKNKPNIASIEDNVDDLNNGEFPSDWRTPTKDEWNYLIKTRSASTVAGTANARFIAAQVNDVNGLIILPDIFTLPDGIIMSYINNLSPRYNRNVYTLEQWVSLNAAGCIFLPVTGNRYERSVYSQSVKGYYWSSTQSDNMNAWHFYFGNNQPDDITCYVQGKYYGTAVRLIKENNKGLFSISTNTKCTIASSNLQYHCLNKEWRFAPNAYDVIGSANANIAENYDGWIDLFGFGTSGWNSGAVRYQPWSTNSVAPEYINHDLTGEYKKADWGVYNIKKQLHEVAFSGDYNDLSNKPVHELAALTDLDDLITNTSLIKDHIYYITGGTDVYLATSNITCIELSGNPYGR